MLAIFWEGSSWENFCQKPPNLFYFENNAIHNIMCVFSFKKKLLWKISNLHKKKREWYNKSLCVNHLASIIINKWPINNIHPQLFWSKSRISQSLIHKMSVSQIQFLKFFLGPKKRFLETFSLLAFFKLACHPGSSVAYLTTLSHQNTQKGGETESICSFVAFFI